MTMKTIYKTTAALTVAGCLSVTSASADWFDKLLGTLSGGDDSAASLSNSDITSGLKEALRVGSERVVDQLGKTNGFNGDPAIHIPLPKSLTTVQSALEKVGASSMLDDLELKLNRAAEAATPKAKEHFFQAIKEMTLEDAKNIYSGPEDAATRYFQSKMTEPLKQSMRPIVNDSIAEVGAVQAYDRVMDKYDTLPFVPDVKANLSDYVLEQGLNGIFHYLAREEAAIRQDPAARTTDLLKRVFGSG
jgi:hypothetical protein